MAIVSVAGRIGCTAQTLHDWTRKTEVDVGMPLVLRRTWPQRLVCDDCPRFGREEAHTQLNNGSTR